MPVSPHIDSVHPHSSSALLETLLLISVSRVLFPFCFIVLYCHFVILQSRVLCFSSCQDSPLPSGRLLTCPTIHWGHSPTPFLQQPPIIGIPRVHSTVFKIITSSSFLLPFKNILFFFNFCITTSFFRLWFCKGLEWDFLCLSVVWGNYPFKKK